MKKFILDLRLLRYNVIKTALLPSTIVAKRIHNTVNCSVCKEKILFKWNYGKAVNLASMWAAKGMLKDSTKVFSF